jgi:hypothetical protein
MDERVVDPLIDSAVKVVEERIERPVACPLCTRSEWYLIDAERFLRIWAPSELTEAEVESTAELPFDTIRALGFACTNCHFIRLHNFSEEFGESGEAPAEISN